MSSRRLLFALVGALLCSVGRTQDEQTFPAACSEVLPCSTSNSQELDLDLVRQFTELPSTEATIGGVQWIANDTFRLLLSNGTADYRPTEDLVAVSTTAYPDSVQTARQVQGRIAGGTQALSVPDGVIVADTENSNAWSLIPRTEVSAGSIAVSGDGKYVALTYAPIFLQSCAVRLYRYQDGSIEFIAEKTYNEDSMVFGCSCVFSPTNSSIIYAGASSQIVAMAFDGTALEVTETARLANVLSSREAVKNVYVDPQGNFLVVLTGSNYAYFIRLAPSFNLFAAFPLLNLDGTKTVSSQPGGACISPDSSYMVIPTTSFTTVDGIFYENLDPETVLVINIGNESAEVAYNAIVPSESLPNGNQCSFDPSNPGTFVMSQFRLKVVDEGTEVSSSACIMKINSLVSESPSPGESSEPGFTVDNSTNACFPGNALVEVEGGGMVEMHRLETGQRVRTSSTEFSEVFLWTHKVGGLHQFVDLETSQSTLTVSAGHFVHTERGLLAARNIEVGDYLISGLTGNLARVNQKQVSQRWGLYNPQTLDGRIVVNGIQASTYTEALPISIAHGLLWPVRIAFKMTGQSIFGSALEKGGGSIVQWFLKHLSKRG